MQDSFNHPVFKCTNGIPQYLNMNLQYVQQILNPEFNDSSFYPYFKVVDPQKLDLRKK